MSLLKAERSGPLYTPIAPVNLSALAQLGGVAEVIWTMMVATNSSFVENKASSVRAVSTKANDLAPFVSADQSFYFGACAGRRSGLAQLRDVRGDELVLCEEQRIGEQRRGRRTRTARRRSGLSP